MSDRISAILLNGILGVTTACAASPSSSDYTAPVPAVASRDAHAESTTAALASSPRQDLPIVSVAEDLLGNIISLADQSKAAKGKLNADAKKKLRDVSAYVDTLALSQRALGKARWSKLPKSQRDEFIATLNEILEAIVYPQAVKISAKSDEFTYKMAPGSKNTVLVHGTVQRQKLGEMISNPFEMRLEFDLKTKKVVDAIIEKEAISANLKRQFDRALEKRDFSAIIDLMKKRVAKARSEGTAGA